MRILTYKRTHTGDPDAHGRFGVHDCMGTVRSLPFDAVIGIGGIGPEPRLYGIDGKLTWLGVGPRRSLLPGLRAEIIEFEHFLLFEENGPQLSSVAPRLAERMYRGRVRYLTRGYSEAELQEAEALVEWCRREATPGAPSESTIGRSQRCKPVNVCSPRRQRPNHSVKGTSCGKPQAAPYLER
jgi:hypothetical protein